MSENFKASYVDQSFKKTAIVYSTFYPLEPICI